MSTQAVPGLVIHLSSGGVDDQRAALRYAANFVSAGTGRPVEIVVNAAALDVVLATSPLSAEVTAAQSGSAVGFRACANTMAARDVGAADLNPVVEIVAAAVAHLAQRQWDGWAYLRP
ncbi:hypothetical protein EB73_21710 [Mycobacterium sp. SWH-M3]|nr:hypothetical protein EB73_21710 [Mycobacterium sp. SWH-M3]